MARPPALRRSTGRTLVVVVVAALALAACSDDGGNAREPLPTTTTTTAVLSTTTTALQPMETNEAYAACEDGRTQQDLNECAGREREQAEAVLAEVLAAVRVNHPDEAGVLESTQALWLTYRDAFCNSYYDQGGSIQPLNSAACKASLTAERSLALCIWDNPNVSLDSGNHSDVCRELLTSN